MLMGFELLREIVGSTILTGRLKNHNPLSLLLIAPPERGKTSIVLERNAESVAAFSDCTGKGIQDMCLHHPEISHFVLTDMITVTSHRSSVVRYTISVLNAMTEEGLQGIAFPGQVTTFQNGRRAIIGCLTPTAVNDQRTWWSRSGFASRMLPFSFEHSEDMTLKIKNHIENNHHAVNKIEKSKTEIKIKIPKEPVIITVPEERIREIRNMADSKAKELDEKGYRRLKQFITLACGHALFRTGKTGKVEKEDTIFLLHIQPYISYTRSVIL